jgi:hypothetical protein
MQATAGEQVPEVHTGRHDGDPDVAVRDVRVPQLCDPHDLWTASRGNDDCTHRQTPADGCQQHTRVSQKTMSPFGSGPVVGQPRTSSAGASRT